jgi:hypothetical protein
MIQWEYEAVNAEDKWPYGVSLSSAPVKEFLNERGKDGWELVQMKERPAHFLFKRQVRT